MTSVLTNDKKTHKINAISIQTDKGQEYARKMQIGGPIAVVGDSIRVICTESRSDVEIVVARVVEHDAFILIQVAHV